jgi:hypothetical protein
VSSVKKWTRKPWTDKDVDSGKYPKGESYALYEVRSAVSLPEYDRYNGRREGAEVRSRGPAMPTSGSRHAHVIRPYTLPINHKTFSKETFHDDCSLTISAYVHKKDHTSIQNKETVIVSRTLRSISPYLNEFIFYRE